jgi:hypothetical protein
MWTASSWSLSVTDLVGRQQVAQRNPFACPPARGQGANLETSYLSQTSSLNLLPFPVETIEKIPLTRKILTCCRTRTSIPSVRASNLPTSCWSATL